MDIRQLVRGPANLCVAFNKIKSKVQGREVTPTDFELKHYQKSIPRKEKNGEKILGIGHSPKNAGVNATPPHALI